MGILRIEDHVDAASAIVEVENLFPGLAAVAGAEDAAVGVGAVSVAKSGDEGDIRIGGMDDDGADVASVLQADVAPGLAGVAGTIDAIAERDVAADAGFTAADVNHIGIGFGDGDGADGRGGLLLEEGIPGVARVGGFPNASGDGAKIESVGLAGHAGYGNGASAAEGADEAPLYAVVCFGVDGIGGLLGIGGLKEQEADKNKGNCDSDSADKCFHTNLRIASSEAVHVITVGRAELTQSSQRWEHKGRGEALSSAERDAVRGGIEIGWRIKRREAWDFKRHLMWW